MAHSYLDLIRASYILYGVKYIDPVSLAVIACSVTGLRPGMPRGPAGAAGSQTLHTKLPYITPSMTISSNK